MIGILGDTPGAFSELVECTWCRQVVPSEAIKEIAPDVEYWCPDCVAGPANVVRLPSGRLNMHQLADHHALYRTSVENRDPLAELIAGWDPWHSDYCYEFRVPDPDRFVMGLGHDNPNFRWVSYVEVPNEVIH